jgi:hypothetical protein
MRVFRWLLLGLALTALLGCIPNLKGSGKLVSKNWNLTDFTRVEAGHGFTLKLTQAAAQGIEIRIDDNLIEHLRVEKRGRTLVIGMNSAYNYNVDSDSMQAVIVMPKLEGLCLSGAAHAQFKGLTVSERFELDLSGASGVRGQLTTKHLDADLSGASTMDLTGSAERAELELSGASQAKLKDFKLGEARVNLSGASDAKLLVSGRLSGDASGASSLRYLGKPQQVAVDTSGASSIRAD